MKTLRTIKTMKGRTVKVQVPETEQERQYVEQLRSQGKIETRASSGDFERSVKPAPAKTKK